MEVQQVSAEKLTPNDFNPNRMTSHQRRLLKKSIERDGMIQPVIALPDGTIIDGEHRWRICRELKLDVPVVYLDRDEAERRLTNLRLNTARGKHDLDLERAVIDFLREGGVDLNFELLIDPAHEQLAAVMEEELPPLAADWKVIVDFDDYDAALTWLATRGIKEFDTDEISRQITVRQ